ncbi:MAG: OmpA family protein, partial [Rickettsiales bacterium]|nr:OmpA family protein [Rickettsiales bacterium]
MKILFFLISLFLICGCHKKYLKEEEKFYKTLENLYSSYSDFKKGNFDYDIGNEFAEKALIIRSGRALEPISFFEFKNPVYRSSTIREFSDFRERMMLVLQNSLAKTDYANDSANLQFYYDCWIREEEIYTKFGQIARCRKGFLDTLYYLEFRLSNITDEIRVEIERDRKMSIPPERAKKFIVYFDFDSSAINSEGSKNIWKIIKYVSTLKNYKIRIFGHADRVGTLKYNKKLSDRRSKTVKH